jgi:hypothetical protein
VRFGLPAVGGISTEALAGELDGRASLEEVAEDFTLGIGVVRWAQSYELSQRTVAMSPRAAKVRIYVDADVLGLVVGSRRHSPAAVAAVISGRIALSGRVIRPARQLEGDLYMLCGLAVLDRHRPGPYREPAPQAARTLLTRRCGGQLR